MPGGGIGGGGWNGGGGIPNIGGGGGIPIGGPPIPIPIPIPIGPPAGPAENIVFGLACPTLRSAEFCAASNLSAGVPCLSPLVSCAGFPSRHATADNTVSARSTVRSGRAA